MNKVLASTRKTGHGNFEDILSYFLFVVGVIAVFFTDRISHELGLSNAYALGLLIIYFSALVRINGLRRQLQRMQQDIEQLRGPKPPRREISPSMPPGEA